MSVPDAGGAGAAGPSRGGSAARRSGGLMAGRLRAEPTDRRLRAEPTDRRPRAEPTDRRPRAEPTARARRHWAPSPESADRGSLPGSSRSPPAPVRGPPTPGGRPAAVRRSVREVRWQSRLGRSRRLDRSTRVSRRCRPAAGSLLRIMRSSRRGMLHGRRFRVGRVPLDGCGGSGSAGRPGSAPHRGPRSAARPAAVRSADRPWQQPVSPTRPAGSPSAASHPVNARRPGCPGATDVRRGRRRPGTSSAGSAPATAGSTPCVGPASGWLPARVVRVGRNRLARPAGATVSEHGCARARLPPLAARAAENRPDPR